MDHFSGGLCAKSSSLLLLGRKVRGEGPVPSMRPFTVQNAVTRSEYALFIHDPSRQVSPASVIKRETAMDR